MLTVKEKKKQFIFSITDNILLIFKIIEEHVFQLFSAFRKRLMI